MLLSKSYINRLFKSLIVVLIFPIIVNATPTLEVFLPDEISKYEMSLLSLDIIEENENSSVIMGWPYDIELLEQSSLTYRIDNENIEKFYRDRLANSLTLDEAGDMGGYHTMSELYQWALDLKTDFPEIVSSPDTIGYTFENRPIWVIKISDNPEIDENEDEVFFNGAIHAGEVINPYVLMFFADQLCENYGDNTRITDVVNSREIWIMPVINVDGYCYNEELHPEGGGGWRKNKRTIDGILYGVDLNRNFPTYWGIENGDASSDPNSTRYFGQSPASEPETQAVINFCNSHNFKMAINYHSSGTIVVAPIRQNQTNPGCYTNFIDYSLDNLGENWSTGYGWFPGGASDWMATDANNIIFNLLIETGHSMWPTIEVREEIAEEQADLLLALCELGNPLKFQSTEPPFLHEIPDIVGTEFSLSWIASPENYEILAENYEILSLSNETMTDNLEIENNPTWNSFGFERDNLEAHSGEYSYACYSEGNRINHLISSETYTVEENDTLSFWTKFYLFNGDSLFVQVETESTTFALEGNFTSPTGSIEFDLAHVITGFQGDWVLAEFPLSMHAGSDVKFKFRHHSGETLGIAPFRIDDISPISTWEDITILESGISDTSFLMDLTDVIQEGELTLGIRGHNVYGGSSLPSNGVITYYDPNYESIELSQIPEGFRVDCVHPNPFNPSTRLNVTLPSVGQLTVSVHDILGRQVDLLNMGNCSAGQQTFNLNGSSWASGLYFIKVDFVGSKGIHHSDIQKVMLIK